MISTRIRHIIHTPMILLFAAEVVPAIPNPSTMTPIIEIWRATGLQGLSLLVAIAALYLVKYFVDKFIELSKEQAATTAKLNSNLENLVRELRQRTRIVDTANDDTPFTKNFSPE